LIAAEKACKLKYPFRIKQMQAFSASRLALEENVIT
jgi:hypothetical protein